ncbi:MAG: hypothetical protein ACE5K3_11445, partial [bacterium]
SIMTKYIWDTRICSDECDQQKNSPPSPLSFKERGIKGGELSAGSIGPVPSGAYFSISGAKVTGSR